MDWIHDPTWLKVARAQGSVSIPRRNIASYYETVIYKLISYDDGNDSTRSPSVQEVEQENPKAHSRSDGVAMLNFALEARHASMLVIDSSIGTGVRLSRQGFRSVSFGDAFVRCEPLT
jgi:amino acid permease